MSSQHASPSILVFRGKMFSTDATMEIKDRDYMRDSEGKGDVVKLSDILIILMKLVVLFVAFILCLRIPSLWIKIPLVIGVFYGGWRWIFGAKTKKTGQSTRSTQSVEDAAVESPEDHQSTIQAGAGHTPKPDLNAVRLLTAFDAAGEYGKAKALIQQLDGKEFPELVGKEFASVAGNYFPIKLKPTKYGVRFFLD